MVLVVVDPFVEQVLDAEGTREFVLAGLLQVARIQPLDQRDTFGADGAELGHQVGQRSSVIASPPLHLDLVPVLDREAGSLQDLANAPAKTAALGLDNVPQALLDGPLTGRGVPGGELLREHLEARCYGGPGRRQPAGHLSRCQRARLSQSPVLTLSVGSWARPGPELPAPCSFPAAAGRRPP